ncbi:hypothetical protein DSC45_20995 [Streptomyces sp. YIM 130001]|uniref:hypothetical protein n=1 Tax=Streptomyces sp. YIM 130001 TaxID=2259644 RepID=UPI000EC334B7|nr:hypothetical protein [Streptomyces sp. YIM 130001]RII14836.1 hypothetical protein DSC45_20995 [Streptomyces sp. YIM 130001]
MTVLLLVWGMVAGAGGGPAGYRAGSTAHTVGAAEQATEAKGREPRLRVPLTYFLVPADERGKSGDPRRRQMDLDVEIDNLANEPGGRPFGRITLDVSGLSGKVAFGQDGSGECKGYGTTKIHCPVDSDRPVFTTYLRALESGRNGESGVLRYTFTPHKGKTLTASTKVVIGRPRLAVVQPPMRKGVKRTESVRVPVTFKNVGEIPVHGITADISPGRTLGMKHRNCRYIEASMTCDFPDAVVRPGQTMTLSPTPRVLNAEPAMYESVSFSVRPLEPSGDPGYGELGSGSPLRLVDASPARGALREPDEPGGETLMYLQRPTRADYEVTGLHLSKESDRRVRARVGVRNNGPSSVPGLGGLYYAKVTFPMGSTVVKTPRDESLEEDAELCQKVSGTEYRCEVSPRSGETNTFDFVVRPGWWGQTKVEITDSERFPRRDPRPANDTAAVATPAGPLHTALSATLGVVVIAGALALTRRHWLKPLKRVARR